MCGQWEWLPETKVHHAGKQPTRFTSEHVPVFKASPVCFFHVWFPLPAGMRTSGLRTRVWSLMKLPWRPPTGSCLLLPCCFEPHVNQRGGGRSVAESLAKEHGFLWGHRPAAAMRSIGHSA